MAVSTGSVVALGLAAVVGSACLAIAGASGSDGRDVADQALPPGVDEVPTRGKPLAEGREAYLRQDGRLAGRRTYDRAGHLLLERRYRHELRHGPQRAWYPDAKLRSLVTYRDGIPDGLAAAWAPDGKPLWNTQIRAGDGILRTFHTDGSPDTTTPHRAGLMHGTQLAYRADGSLRNLTPYARGRIDGTARGYYPDGRVESEADCRDGQSHGITRSWTPDGRPANSYRQIEADTPADYHDRAVSPYDYLHGQRVDRLAFDRAAAADPELARRAELTRVADRVDPTRLESMTDPFAPSPFPPLEPPRRGRRPVRRPRPPEERRPMPRPSDANPRGAAAAALAALALLSAAPPQRPDPDPDPDIAALVARAADDDPGTRDRAIAALVDSRRRVVAAMIARVRPGPGQPYPGEVRAASAYLLGKLRAPEAVTALAAALADPSMPENQRPGKSLDRDPHDDAAWTALVHIGRPAAPAMIAHVEASDDVQLRQQSLFVLQHVLGGKRRTLELLDKLRARATDPAVIRRVEDARRWFEETVKEDVEPLF